MSSVMRGRNELAKGFPSTLTRHRICTSMGLLPAVGEALYIHCQLSQMKICPFQLEI